MGINRQRERSVRVRMILFLAVLLAPVVLVGQGFDWQYSARLPAEYPTLFVGVTGLGSLQRFNGDINYVQGVVLCGTFSKGTGSGFGGGIQVDNWLTPALALTGSIRYETLGGTFTSAGDTLARAPDTRPTIVAYEIESDFSYALLDVGLRYRPFLSAKFFVGAGLQAGALLSSSTLQRQRIVSPAEQRFSDGSQEQSLKDYIVGFRSFFVGGRVSAGMDVPLANSLYASPALFAGFPVTSMATDASWQRISYGVQVSVLYGIR